MARSRTSVKRIVHFARLHVPTLLTSSDNLSFSDRRGKRQNDFFEGGNKCFFCAIYFRKRGDNESQCLFGCIYSDLRHDI